MPVFTSYSCRFVFTCQAVASREGGFVVKIPQCPTSRTRSSTKFTSNSLRFPRVSESRNKSGLVRYDSRASERCGVRDRSGDIVAVQPPIKRDGFAVALRNFCSGFVESSFAHRQPTDAVRVTVAE